MNPNMGALDRLFQIVAAFVIGYLYFFTNHIKGPLGIGLVVLACVFVLIPSCADLDRIRSKIGCCIRAFSAGNESRSAQRRMTRFIGWCPLYAPFRISTRRTK
jgi:hypothetical protein